MPSTGQNLFVFNFVDKSSETFQTHILDDGTPVHTAHVFNYERLCETRLDRALSALSNLTFLFWCHPLLLGVTGAPPPHPLSDAPGSSSSSISIIITRLLGGASGARLLIR